MPAQLNCMRCANVSGGQLDMRTCHLFKQGKAITRDKQWITLQTRFHGATYKLSREEASQWTVEVSDIHPQHQLHVQVFVRPPCPHQNKVIVVLLNFITPTEEVMFSPELLLLWLSAGLPKNHWINFQDTWWTGHGWARTTFGSLQHAR